MPESEPLRVAVDATPLLAVKTGVGAFCHDLLGALPARSELSVTAFAVTWRMRERLEGLVPEGVSIVQRPMPARPIQWMWARAPTPPIEWFVGAADVVHGTNFVVPPTHRAARVATVHDLTPLYYPELCDDYTRTFPAKLTRAIAAGAWVHTHSDFIARQVVEAFDIDQERVRRIHPGIPGIPGVPGVPVPAGGGGGGGDTREPGVNLPEGTSRYIFAIGTIEPRKDYPGLVAAFDRIEADDVALVISGRSGWGAETFEAALQASRRRDRIIRVGYADEPTVRKLMAGATVLAFPSVYEGFGFPPLEAMRLGVPVVATSAGSVPEVVGDAALLVPPRDPDSLAAALTRALEDPELRARLVGRGRCQAAQYSWVACAEGMARLYADADAARSER